MTENEPNKLAVMLVDDQALVRSGFRMLIDAEDDMEVVAEASDGNEALDVLAPLLPHALDQLTGGDH